MKELHGKGLATHAGPESCGAAREGSAEALTGVRAVIPHVRICGGGVGQLASLLRLQVVMQRTPTALVAWFVRRRPRVDGSLGRASATRDALDA
jgi:hypothetical protein